MLCFNKRYWLAVFVRLSIMPLCGCVAPIFGCLIAAMQHQPAYILHAGKHICTLASWLFVPNACAEHSASAATVAMHASSLLRRLRCAVLGSAGGWRRFLTTSAGYVRGTGGFHIFRR
jgi:hypothetical protein